MASRVGTRPDQIDVSHFCLVEFAEVLLDDNGLPWLRTRIERSEVYGQIDFVSLGRCEPDVHATVAVEVADAVLGAVEQKEPAVNRNASTIVVLVAVDLWTHVNWFSPRSIRQTIADVKIVLAVPAFGSRMEHEVALIGSNEWVHFGVSCGSAVFT